MTTVDLLGVHTSALGILAPVGLAGVLEDAGLTPASFRWDPDRDPSRATVTCSAESALAVAQAVREHAARHTLGDSWIQASVSRGTVAEKGLFSPRAGIKAADWTGFLAQRAEVLAQSSRRLTPLDRALMAGLGEPAWWRADDKDAQPDKGASRWEMKTRNRGEEIVANRLRPLADAVSRRSAPQVLAGLVGLDTVDECGAGKADSRTATGLTTPQPTDNALAWLGLWGLAALPVLPVSGAAGATNGYSQTPGMWPRRRVHPDRAVLPVVTRLHTWRSYRSLVLTRDFDTAAFRGATPEAPAARAWLKEQGVVALVRFGVVQLGSPSAPERQIMSGTTDVL